MAKIKYNDITFDSELEIDYYKHLLEDEKVIRFVYHPSSIQITKNNRYTPDFIVEYKDKRIVVIETKGYNQFSFMKDNMTHNLMLSKPNEELREYVKENGFDIEDKDVSYQKIKKLKGIGFVDFSYKNPNTNIARARNKLKATKTSLKTSELRIKELERYIGYLKKDKLVKSQREWKKNFEIKEGIIKQ